MLRLLPSFGLRPFLTFFVPAAVVALACAPSDFHAPATTLGPDEAPYDFARPDVLLELHDDLNEISGLTVLDSTSLGAVEDEHGMLYVLDAETGAVRDKLKFAGKGDFEGIERAGTRIFALRSDGSLFELGSWPEHEKQDTKKHKTGLSSTYDTEGLAYDADGLRLLIACKEYPGKGLGRKKAVYAFDVRKDEFVDAPVLLIDPATFEKAARNGNTLKSRLRAVIDFFSDTVEFKPSALAVHPHTGHVYVLSSVQKAVVRLDRDGTLLDVWPLSGSLFPQPEGLTFLPGGDLFIASEGVGGKAVLARFRARDDSGEASR